MITNADMTIYNKYFDKSTRTDKYKRFNINNVFWDNVEGSSRVRSGLEQADKVLVLIPMESCPNGAYFEPKEFLGAENTFTFQIGDRIVKNAIDFDIKDRPNDLDRNYTAYTISSIDLKDFGSKSMQHWEIRGR